MTCKPATHASNLTWEYTRNVIYIEPAAHFEFSIESKKASGEFKRSAIITLKTYTYNLSTLSMYNNALT